MRKHLLLAIAMILGTLGVNAMAHTRSGDTIDAPVFLAQADVPLVDPAGETPREPMPAFMVIDAGPETGHAAEVSGPTDEATPAAPTGPATGAEVGSNADLLAKYEAAKKALADRDKHGLMLGIAGLVAALSWLLIAGIKRFSSITDVGKRWLPRVALGLGVIGGLTAEYAAGLPWYQAIVVGAAPALSVFFHELVKKPAGAGKA